MEREMLLSEPAARPTAPRLPTAPDLAGAPDTDADASPRPVPAEAVRRLRAALDAEAQRLPRRLATSLAE